MKEQVQTNFEKKSEKPDYRLIPISSWNSRGLNDILDICRSYEAEDFQSVKEGLIITIESLTRTDFCKSIPELYEGVAQVMNFGAEKYSPYSWESLKVEDYLKAALRHCIAAGINLDSAKDQESSIHHWKHLASNLLIALSLFEVEEEAATERLKEVGVIPNA